MKKKLLIVEDEYSINDILAYTFQREGYEVKSVLDAKSMWEVLDLFSPDLILLDAMLPDGDGFEICKEIAHKYLVIMVTARDSLLDKLVGIELGADDYITKPFEIREVVVRVKALFRMLEKENVSLETQLTNITEDVTVDLKGERIFRQEEEIKLKRKEWELFAYLLTHRNQVLTRERLLEEIWGYDFLGDTRTVDVHIRRIRSQLGLEKEGPIETVFGKGYVMR